MKVVVPSDSRDGLMGRGRTGDMSREGFGLLTTYSMMRFTTRR